LSSKKARVGSFSTMARTARGSPTGPRRVKASASITRSLGASPVRMTTARTRIRKSPHHLIIRF
jgi:hypothetical protein